jgi:hypothetical protein
MRPVPGVPHRPTDLSAPSARERFRACRGVTLRAGSWRGSVPPPQGGSWGAGGRGGHRREGCSRRGCCHPGCRRVRDRRDRARLDEPRVGDERFRIGEQSSGEGRAGGGVGRDEPEQLRDECRIGRAGRRVGESPRDDCLAVDRSGVTPGRIVEIRSTAGALWSPARFDQAAVNGRGAAASGLRNARAAASAPPPRRLRAAPAPPPRRPRAAPAPPPRRPRAAVGLPFGLSWRSGGSQDRLSRAA